MKYIGKKRLFISLIITFLIVGMFAPLYGASTMFDSIYRSQFSNKKSTVQLSNTTGGGNSNGYINVLLPQGSYDYCKDKENCIILTEKISSDWQNHKIQFQTFGSNQVTIRLSSPKKENSKRIKYPVVVDYQNLKINNKLIFSETKALLDDKPFEYTLKVHNGETVELEADIRRHHWTFDEIKDLQHFNPLMLLSIFILAFFFSYQIVQYVAQYKILQHYSRIDIVFLVAFVILLLIPASHISKEEKSMRENRILASFPSLFINNTFNTNYTKQFEDWFNDRFRGRRTFLELYTNLKTANVMIKTDQASYHKKTHWIFNQNQVHHQTLSYQTNAEILLTFQNMNNFFIKKGIKFYILIVPEKIDLYKNFVEIYRSAFWTQTESSFNISTIDFLKKNATFPIIYPLEALKKASEKDFVYFKTEHHWTEWGAYQGYTELIKSIQKKYPKIKVLGEDAFEIFYNNKVRGDWDRKFGIGESFGLVNLGSEEINEKEVLDTPYKYYTPKSSLKQDISDKLGIKHFINVKSTNHIRVALIGTSMNENLLPFLPYSFYELKYFRMNWGDIQEDMFKLFKRYKKDILDFKPDILILSVSSANLPDLIDLTKE